MKKEIDVNSIGTAGYVVKVFKSSDPIEEFNVKYQEITLYNACKYSNKALKKFSTVVSCVWKKESYLLQDYLKVFEDILFHCQNPKIKH